MEARIMPSAVSCTCRGTDALPTSVVEPGQVYAFRDVILNPVAVPPLLRVNLDAIELHAEVDMVACSHTRHATCAHYLPSLHHVAFVYGNLAEMAIDGLQPIAMVHRDAV